MVGVGGGGIIEKVDEPNQTGNFIIRWRDRGTLPGMAPRPSTQPFASFQRPITPRSLMESWPKDTG